MEFSKKQKNNGLWKKRRRLKKYVLSPSIYEFSYLCWNSPGIKYFTKIHPTTAYLL